MKSITKMTATLACVASAATFAWAAPKDITSAYNPNPDGTPAASGVLNVEARYNVHVGFAGVSSGLTTALAPNSIGLAEYHSSGGNNGNWGRLNNGFTVFNSPVVNAATDETFTPNTFGGVNPDFGGFLFNCPATVTQVKFWNRTYADGGTFAATPTVQYLDDMEPFGTWHSVSVTWDTPYVTDIAPANVTRAYVLTLDTPVSGVWGIRLIGDGNPAGGNATDPTGWVGFQELIVIGELELGTTELNKNKALAGGSNGATAIANAEQGAGQTVRLNDGNLTTRSQTYGPWAFQDWLGIAWTEPQYGVTSLGVNFMGFFDGGYFNDCRYPLQIEYTFSPNPGIDPALAEWHTATGLNKRRYPFVQPRISCINGNPQLGFLFSFDELNGITGIRIIGDPDGDGGDRDGFLGCFEVEVFGRTVLGEIIANYDSTGDSVLDVDAADLTKFMECWSGPAVPFALNCDNRDLDSDGDVDGDDFAVFQRCFSGSGIAADIFCAD